MAVLVFRRTLAADPETVWSLLTVPAEMNRWSIARIDGVQPGEGGRYDVAGARRRVTVGAFGITSRLEEEIVEAERPTRFVYRVVSGGGLRDHRGVQTLAVAGAATVLTWEVTFRAAIPGMTGILAGLLRPRLEQSLDALERVLGSR